MLIPTSTWCLVELMDSCELVRVLRSMDSPYPSPVEERWGQESLGTLPRIQGELQCSIQLFLILSFKLKLETFKDDQARDQRDAKNNDHLTLLHNLNHFRSRESNTFLQNYEGSPRRMWNETKHWLPQIDICASPETVCSLPR